MKLANMAAVKNNPPITTAGVMRSHKNMSKKLIEKEKTEIVGSDPEIRNVMFPIKVIICHCFIFSLPTMKCMLQIDLNPIDIFAHWEKGFAMVTAKPYASSNSSVFKVFLEDVVFNSVDLVLGRCNLSLVIVFV